jgi:hypothetical protein
MAKNTQSNSIASIKASYHPARASNAYHAGTVAAQATVHYNSSVGSIYDDNATRIKKSGTTFLPETLDQVAVLEVQVTRGVVIKT